MTPKRRSIILITLFLFCKTTSSKSTPDTKEATDAIFETGLRLHPLLQKTDENAKNFLISPLSASFLLAQLMLGAEGNLRNQLYRLMSFPDKSPDSPGLPNFVSSLLGELPNSNVHFQFGYLLRELNRGPRVENSFLLNITNALFYNSHLTLKREFKKYLNIYETATLSMNFADDPVGCQNSINNWAEKHSNGLIKTILTVGISHIPKINPVNSNMKMMKIRILKRIFRCIF